MNRNQLEVAAEERLFDAMLDEVVQERVAARGTRERGRSRWLVAALMLLGLGVVVGVVVTSRSGAAVAVTPQEPVQEPVQEPLPPVVKVRGLAELQALDCGATNLWYQLRKPEELDALARFAQLRSVVVEPDPDLSHEEMTTAVWSLSPLAECGSLEHVTIGYFGKLKLAEFTVLTRLPKLRSLTLLGRDKVVDAELGVLLGKLPLRSLALHAIDVQPEGMRALGELPLLERLELLDCTGLEKCDLAHLYRLRQLRSLALRGVQPSTWSWRRFPGHDALQPSILTLYPLQPPLAPTEEEWASKAVRDGRTISAAWVRGLAKALPDLRELDFSGSYLDDEVLGALPRRLRSLRLVSTGGFGKDGVAAVAALPELKTLACSDPQPPQGTTGSIPIVTWRGLLLHKKLQRFEYVVSAGLPVEELSGQTELEELRFDLSGQPSHYVFYVSGEGRAGPPVEVPVPDFACLAGLPKLTEIELLAPSPAIEAAIRQAVPARVRIEILPR